MSRHLAARAKLVFVSGLAFITADSARSQVTCAPGLTASIAPAAPALGEPVTVTLENNSNTTYFLPTGCVFKSVHQGSCSGPAVLTPTCAQVLTPIAPGDSLSQVWDQKDDQGESVAPGVYGFSISVVGHSGCCPTVSIEAPFSNVFSIDGEFQLGQLGYAVDGVGDVDMDGYGDFIAGAPGAFSNLGVAYVFSGKDHSVLFSIAGSFAGGRFGQAVAGVGDADGDGYPDFAVGAPLSDATGDDSGAVWVFSGFDGSTMSTLMGPFAGARFGHSIAGLGDIDHDFYDDFAVGAPEGGFAEPGDPSTSANGAVFVFRGFHFDELFHFFGEEAGDRLGWSVSGIRDVNLDFHNDVLVGAPRADLFFDSAIYPHGDDLNYVDAGKVYVISGKENPLGSPDVSRLLQVLVNEEWGPKAFEYFGWSVGCIADIGDADDRDEVLIGAPDGGDSHDRGRVYLVESEFEGPFSGGAYDPLDEPFFDPDETWAVEGDENSVDFGHDLAGGADLSHTPPGDGTPDLIVGDPSATNPFLVSGSNAGRGWIFDGWVWEGHFESALMTAADAASLDGVVFFEDGERNGDRLGFSACANAYPSDYGHTQAIFGAPDVDSEDPDLANAGRIRFWDDADFGSILRHGPACSTATSGAEFHLDATGNPTAGGKVDIEIDAFANATFFLILGEHQAMVPVELFGPFSGFDASECGLYVDIFHPFSFFGPFSTDGFGTAALPVSFPFPGTFVLQALVVHGPAVGEPADRFSLTNGVEVQIE